MRRNTSPHLATWNSRRTLLSLARCLWWAIQFDRSFLCPLFYFAPPSIAPMPPMTATVAQPSSTIKTNPIHHQRPGPLLSSIILSPTAACGIPPCSPWRGMRRPAPLSAASKFANSLLWSHDARVLFLLFAAFFQPPFDFPLRRRLRLGGRCGVGFRFLFVFHHFSFSIGAGTAVQPAPCLLLHTNSTNTKSIRFAAIFYAASQRSVQVGLVSNPTVIFWIASGVPDIWPRVPLASLHGYKTTALPLNACAACPGQAMAGYTYRLLFCAFNLAAHGSPMAALAQVR